MNEMTTERARANHTTRSPPPRLCAAAAVLCLAVASEGGTILHTVSDDLYLDLASNANYDSVGLVRWTESGASYQGSGTYLGDGWVLTAAHVADGTDYLGGGNINWEFTVAGQTYTADEFVVHPDWASSEGDLTAGVDIALVQLTSDPIGVTPAVVYDEFDEDQYTATLVGYGSTGTGVSGYAANSSGEKRAGENTIDAFGGDRQVRGYSDTIAFTDFDEPGSRSNNQLGSGTPLDLEYMTAPGDSGGGLFIDVDGVAYLAGVTSFGLAFDGHVDSDYGDLGGYVRTSMFIDWIESVTGIVAGQAALFLEGDYNFDGVVDAADYSLWRDSAPLDSTDAGYDLWVANYGRSATGSSATIPEPCGAWLAAMTALACEIGRKRSA